MGLYEDIARRQDRGRRPVYGMSCRERRDSRPVESGVPSSTDLRIEELCARIRVLCNKPFSPEAEAELRKLARQLRVAIRQHVRMAKANLGAKKSAIIQRDPDG